MQEWGHDVQHIFQEHPWAKARCGASCNRALQNPEQMHGTCREAAELGEPEYGTLNWVTLCALKLTANKVLTNVERKKLYLQTLVLLITGNAAKHTDLNIVMGILTVVRTWLLHPVVVHVPGKPSEYISLTEKVGSQALPLPQAKCHTQALCNAECADMTSYPRLLCCAHRQAFLHTQPSCCDPSDGIIGSSQWCPAALCAAQEAILFLQRLATLARSGYKGPVQQKWEATFLDMIHQLCTSSNLPQVTAARAPHMPDALITYPPKTAMSLAGLCLGPQSCLC